jgi:hypothetical protein
MYLHERIGSRILVPKTRFGSRMAVEFSAVILLVKLASLLSGESGSSRRPFTTTLAQFKRSFIVLSIDIIARGRYITVGSVFCKG